MQIDGYINYVFRMITVRKKPIICERRGKNQLGLPSRPRIIIMDRHQSSQTEYVTIFVINRSDFMKYSRVCRRRERIIFKPVLEHLTFLPATATAIL